MTDEWVDLIQSVGCCCLKWLAKKVRQRRTEQGRSGHARLRWSRWWPLKPYIVVGYFPAVIKGPVRLPFAVITVR